MSSWDVLMTGAFVVAAWAACALAAGTMLWFVAAAGSWLGKALDWVSPRREEAPARPKGRKHGRRATAAPMPTYVPVDIRRRVFPLV